MGNPPSPPPIPRHLLPGYEPKTTWGALLWRCEYCRRPNFHAVPTCYGCGAPQPKDR